MRTIVSVPVKNIPTHGPTFCSAFYLNVYILPLLSKPYEYQRPLMRAAGLAVAFCGSSLQSLGVLLQKKAQNDLTGTVDMMLGSHIILNAGKYHTSKFYVFLAPELTP